MEERIDLPNRYGAENYLSLIPDTKYDYELHLDDNCNYLRESKDANGTIAFIDPEGGPFISVGYKYGDHTLVKISYNEAKHAYILTF